MYEYQRSRSFINLVSLTTAEPIEVKFYMEPPWNGRPKICSNGLGHMTNMAAMPYRVKTLKNLPLWNQKAVVQVYSNDDHGLTLTYFTARSNLVPYALVREKGKTMDFSGTILVCDIEVGGCSQLNEYMILY